MRSARSCSIFAEYERAAAWKMLAGERGHARAGFTRVCRPCLHAIAGQAHVVALSIVPPQLGPQAFFHPNLVPKPPVEPDCIVLVYGSRMIRWGTSARPSSTTHSNWQL